MDHMRRESGAGKIGTIIGLIILVVAIVVAVKWVPARVKVYELKDFAEVQSRQRALAQIRSNEALMETVLKKARDLEIPLKPENIIVKETSSSFKINLKYTYPLNFILYTHNWQIDQTVEAIKISM